MIEAERIDGCFSLQSTLQCGRRRSRRIICCWAFWITLYPTYDPECMLRLTRISQLVLMQHVLTDNGTAVPNVRYHFLATAAMHGVEMLVSS